MRHLYIDQIPSETRAALLINDQLAALHIFRNSDTDNAPLEAGNIYMGRVVKVVPSLQAAFIDIGAPENGFLPAQGLGVEDINGVLHEGQALLVQVKREPQGTKGALLSARLELTSSDCILTPQKPGVNVSRKFSDPDKRNLIRETLQNRLPEETGLIVRTSAQTQTPEQVYAQADSLLALWQQISSRQDKAPFCAYAQRDAWDRIYDLYRDNPPDSIETDSLDIARKAMHLCNETSHYTDRPALFDARAIEELIDNAVHSVVPLEKGGNIIIERTSALIAVDVNMGNRHDGRNDEDNRLKTNLSALESLYTQIQLRNLSGQILVDFITLKSPKHRSQLSEACQKMFGADQRSHVHGFTRLGLLELSRARNGYGLDELQCDLLSLCFTLVRRLANMTGKASLSIEMGSRLYRLWQSNEMAPNRDWLCARLGYAPTSRENPQLPPLSYKIGE